MGKKKKNNTIKIAGQKINIGKKLGAGEIRDIAAATGKSVAQVLNKASNQDVKVSSAAQNVVARATPRPATPAPASPSPSSSSSSAGGGYSGGATSVDDFYFTNPEYAASMQGAELQTRSQISNYGWDTQKAMENIRQAAETERIKYEVDNRIPLVQAESQGKLDLQKIVNAGYKNIANIERGTEMVRNVTSMFNF